MRRVPPEAEALIPRISPTHFTREKCARDLDLSTGEHSSIIDVGPGWKVIGWALSDDVAPRDLCVYVIMCEEISTGRQIWCHCNHYSIARLAKRIENDPSLITPLR